MFLRKSAAAVALLLFVGAPAWAQAQGTVTGRVIQSGTMRPLSGAQVSVAGTGLGALANNDGRFLILNVPAGEARVRVQVIGFGTQERTVSVVSGQTMTVDFELTSEALGLDEIVVTGTAGGQQRRAIGNVVSSISAESQLERTAPSSLQAMLAGQAPGVNVQIGGANAGGGGNVTIRGMSTLTLSTGPLIYIDGVRANNKVVTQNNGVGTSRLNDINPEDIERIEIIKGPAAATLYGTEASNGVIQIITKKGALGSGARIDAVIRQGASWFNNPAGRIPDNYALAADGNTVLVQNLYADEIAAGRPMFRTGHVQSYGINVRGGQERLSYFLSGNHENEEGYHFNNASLRQSLRSNIQLALNDRMDLSTDLGVIRSDGTFAQAGTSGVSGLIPMIIWGSPLTRDLPQRGFMVGPPEVQNDIEIREQLNRATASITFAHRPLDWLSHRLVAGLDWTDNLRSNFYPKLPTGSPAFYAGNSEGFKQVVNDRDLNRTLDYNITASFDLTPDVTSATTFGVQYFTTAFASTTASGTNMATPAVSTVSSAAQRQAAEAFEENKTFGTFVQQTFGWRNQAFLTAAVRADANSAFGEDFDAAYYPKLSGTWVMSDADFWNIGAIESFRLRAAWGRSGLQPATFAAVRTWNPMVGPNDAAAVQPGNVGNPDLRPEVGTEIEVGFDLSMLSNRVTTELTYFNTTTRDAILQERIAPSTGFSGNRFVNAAQITNSGWEVKLDVHPIMNETVQLTLGASGSVIKNVLDDLGGRTIQADTRGRWQHVEGYPVGAMWTKHVSSAEWGGANGRTLVNIQCHGGPAGVRNLPTSEIGNHPEMPCAQAPFFYYGSPGPNRNGSLTQTLSLFNALTINALWVYVGDSRRFSTTDWYRDKTQSSSLRAVEMRKGELDPILAAGIQLVDIEKTWFQRDDFFRLRDLSVSYNLPSRWTEGFGVSRAAITMTGRNLWTWVHPEFSAPNLDPEAKKPHNVLYAWQQVQAPLPHSFVTTMRLTF